MAVYPLILLWLSTFPLIHQISGEDIERDGRYLLQSGHSGPYAGAYKHTTTELRDAILGDNLDLAISLLTASRDVKALGAGLRFPKGDKKYDIYTPERITDPDVITMKAVAGASLRLGDCDWISASLDDPKNYHHQVLGILKLAEVLIIAITPESGVYPAGVNQFRIHVEIISMLADRKFMQQVFDDNPLANLEPLSIHGGAPIAIQDVFAENRLGGVDARCAVTSSLNDDSVKVSLLAY